MRYFKNRQEAGRLLAEKMSFHDRENCAVLALSEGGVLIGAEIAKRLHCALYLLATEDITLPREDAPVATMSTAGTFTYNHDMSAGELEELTGDYRSYIDEERMRTFQHLNRIIGKDGAIKKELLKRHTIILVSDGLSNGLSLDVAADFLKPIMIKKLIIATPFATIPAIDKMHLLADEIYCLSALEDFLNTNHYYEENDLPDHETVVETMKNIVLNW